MLAKLYTRFAIPRMLEDVLPSIEAANFRNLNHVSHFLQSENKGHLNKIDIIK